jgi:hypothetical protein
MSNKICTTHIHFHHPSIASIYYIVPMVVPMILSACFLVTFEVCRQNFCAFLDIKLRPQKCRSIFHQVLIQFLRCYGHNKYKRYTLCYIHILFLSWFIYLFIYFFGGRRLFLFLRGVSRRVQRVGGREIRATGSNNIITIRPFRKHVCFGVLVCDHQPRVQ